MIPRLKWFSVLAIVGGLAAQQCSAADSTRFVNGVATLTKGDIKVIAKTAPAAAKEGLRWGGDEAAPARTLVVSLSVSKAGEKLFVPLSAYGDLGEPQLLSLKQTPTGFDLIILGGDTGTAYDAVLSFEKGWLTRRRVSHHEFPDTAWEETKYSYTINN